MGVAPEAGEKYSKSVLCRALLVILTISGLAAKNELWAFPKPGVSKVGRQPAQLSKRLSELRIEVLDLEQNLIDCLKTQREARANMKKLQQLIRLQREERLLGRKRLVEIEKTISDLEGRRETLKERIRSQQNEIRRNLKVLERSDRVVSGGESGFDIIENERSEAPHRKVLAHLVDRGLKETEALRVDLADAEKLEGQIQEEKQQLVYLFQDLNEQEGVLELNRQLQVELLEKKHHERLVQLENYRKLKNAEAQVERLLKEFNARLELEQAIRTERVASKAMIQGVFAKQKGLLPMPVADGKIVGAFGRGYDSKSGLYVFKKGIEIFTGKRKPVRAVSAGKIAFSGNLPDYGRVAIVDHGDHFYSLCAHLGELSKKMGDPIASGDQIGVTDDSGTPVYFEIRARNVAVNPLQWLSN
ncbi:MAG: hypothetical protein A2428_02695 [Bdellovibrionales bacterium RIFOXYC1_FULL_54_43]|nr:MAG: hypothetical protein A2428_02695 [Bdellovibrionales bacterium RIFOXYC1_FULL_54_43]OFZ81725.1 MAG: hypothetical protein A2603_09630 [Bdellovibrionales bacterium RIFOXYD1_FULL_55_31]